MENISAWANGLVVATVYHEFKHFGRKPIQINSDKLRTTCANVLLDPQSMAAITLGWGYFWSWTGVELSMWSHRAGGPWDLITNRGDKTITAMRPVIGHAAIATYFANNVVDIDINVQVKHVIKRQWPNR